MAKLKKQLCMAITDSSSRAGIVSKWLDGLFKLVKLLCEVKGTNEDPVPAAALMGERSQSLRPDPLEKRDISNIADALMCYSERLLAAISQSGGRFLDKQILVVACAVETLLWGFDATKVPARSTRGGKGRQASFVSEECSRRVDRREHARSICSVGLSGGGKSDRHDAGPAD
jgi:hypothetical protein